jgi:hypothetical protein
MYRRSLIRYEHSRSRSNHKEEKNMVSNEDFAKINAIHLDPIKEKLIHRKGKGWTRDRAEAAEREYRRFLYLVKINPGTPLAPVVDVDEFWHYHILDTKKYAADCHRVFGYFLHHFPYAGMRGEEDEEALNRVAARTRAMYEQEFGMSYVADLEAVAEKQRTAYSSAFRLSTAYGGAPTEAAYCYVTAAKPTAEAAYCYVTQAKPAAEAAYCYVTDAKPAAEASYCYVTEAKPAAEAAYCYVTEAKPAAEAAFCYVTDAKPTAEAAYCYVTEAKPAAQAAFCDVDLAATGQPTGPGASRPLEERLSFYLERPRLN